MLSEESGKQKSIPLLTFLTVKWRSAIGVLWPDGTGTSLVMRDMVMRDGLTLVAILCGYSVLENALLPIGKLLPY